MYYQSEQPKERVLLVGASVHGRTGCPDDEDDPLEELRRLAETAGADVVGEAYQRLKRIEPSTFIGKGKVEEITRLADAVNAGTLLFDVDLSPAQSRTIQQKTGKIVVDRTGLIMDIFAGNARSREARTQVELAQLQYLLPRLTGLWGHFSRHAGGIGTRGPGETQLESDRRLIRKRISKLTEELKKITTRGEVQRRRRGALPRVALVGYTNAGKSTLMNALTGSDVAVADQLFATLDATVRRLRLPGGRTLLLSDTVGFIRNLPAHLIASFRSTLAEVCEADLLLHVVDVTQSHLETHFEAVEDVLATLDAGRIPRVLALNKVDLLPDAAQLEYYYTRYPGSIGLSAASGAGIPRLLDNLEQRIAAFRTAAPPADAGLSSGGDDDAGALSTYL